MQLPLDKFWQYVEMHEGPIDEILVDNATFSMHSNPEHLKDNGVFCNYNEVSSPHSPPMPYGHARGTTNLDIGLYNVVQVDNFEYIRNDERKQWNIHILLKNMCNILKNLDNEKPMDHNVLISACALSTIMADKFQSSLKV